MEPIITHLKNVYPEGRVIASGDLVQAYDKAGELRVAVGRDGLGSIVDLQDKFGALDAFSMEPIPKGARVFKLYAEKGRSKCGRSEEHEERSSLAKELAEVHGGRVPSVRELLEIEADAKKTSRRLPSHDDCKGFCLDSHLEKFGKRKKTSAVEPLGDETAAVAPKKAKAAKKSAK